MAFQLHFNVSSFARATHVEYGLLGEAFIATASCITTLSRLVAFGLESTCVYQIQLKCAES